MEPDKLDYEQLTETLKSMLPEKVLYGDMIGAEGVYAHSGPLVYEDPEPYFIEQAITAITELLERAQKAEKERDEYKELFFSYKHVCGGVDPQRIGELVEADKDGRCVVLPFKPPKMAWTCNANDPKPVKAFYSSAMGIMADMKAGCVFGDTPEAAEAALKAKSKG